MNRREHEDRERTAYLNRSAYALALQLLQIDRFAEMEREIGDIIMRALAPVRPSWPLGME